LRKPFANAAQPTPETAPNTAVKAVAPMTTRVVFYGRARRGASVRERMNDGY
jgi:hypothetical protein